MLRYITHIFLFTLLIGSTACKEQVRKSELDYTDEMTTCCLLDPPPPPPYPKGVIFSSENVNVKIREIKEKFFAELSLVETVDNLGKKSDVIKVFAWNQFDSLDFCFLIPFEFIDKRNKIKLKKNSSNGSFNIGFPNDDYFQSLYEVYIDDKYYKECKKRHEQFDEESYTKGVIKIEYKNVRINN